jgi:hypothetical protein
MPEETPESPVGFRGTLGENVVNNAIKTLDQYCRHIVALLSELSHAQRLSFCMWGISRTHVWSALEYCRTQKVEVAYGVGEELVHRADYLYCLEHEPYGDDKMFDIPELRRELDRQEEFIASLTSKP